MSIKHAFRYIFESNGVVLFVRYNIECRVKNNVDGLTVTPANESKVEAIAIFTTSNFS